MKVMRIEPIRLDEFSNIFIVRVHADERVAGCGEAFHGARAVETYIHESVVPYLLDKDPLEIDRHVRGLCGYAGYRSSDVELRGNSAIGIALWDIFGKETSQPLYQLPGGKVRDSMRTSRSGRTFGEPEPSQPMSWLRGRGRCRATDLLPWFQLRLTISPRKTERVGRSPYAPPGLVMPASAG